MRIVIAGHFDARESAAASLRVRGMAQALLHGGHEVDILDCRREVAIEGEAWTIPASGDEAVLTGTSLDEYADGMASRFPRFIRGLLLGDVTANYIGRKHGKPDAIILYGTHLGYVLRMRRLCSDLGIPLVIDVVEWYSPEDLPGGRFGPYAVANMLSMRSASLYADAFFVISERLARHYARTGKPVINVPPLFGEADAQATKWSVDDGRLHLAYAGSPGAKEAFRTLLGGLHMASDAGTPLTLHLVGMTEADLRAIPDGSTWLDRPGPGLTVCYGRVPNGRARDIVARSDFSLLLRPLRRSNQFGFPSKLAESMMLGTPVIANLFSDLSRVLRDGENAFVLPDISDRSFSVALLRAANQTRDARASLSIKAHEFAMKHFRHQSSAEIIGSVLERLHAVARL